MDAKELERAARKARNQELSRQIRSGDAAAVHKFVEENRTVERLAKKFIVGIDRKPKRVGWPKCLLLDELLSEGAIVVHKAAEKVRGLEPIGDFRKYLFAAIKRAFSEHVDGLAVCGPSARTKRRHNPKTSDDCPLTKSEKGKRNNWLYKLIQSTNCAPAETLLQENLAPIISGIDGASLNGKSDYERREAKLLGEHALDSAIHALTKPLKQIPWPLIMGPNGLKHRPANINPYLRAKVRGAMNGFDADQSASFLAELDEGVRDRRQGRFIRPQLGYEPQAKTPPDENAAAEEYRRIIAKCKTNNEKLVIELRSHGGVNIEIAEKLGVSESTVRTTRNKVEVACHEHESIPGVVHFRELVGKPHRHLQTCVVQNAIFVHAPRRKPLTNPPRHSLPASALETLSRADADVIAGVGCFFGDSLRKENEILDSIKSLCQSEDEYRVISLRNRGFSDAEIAPRMTRPERSEVQVRDIRLRVETLFHDHWNAIDALLRAPAAIDQRRQSRDGWLRLDPGNRGVASSKRSRTRGSEHPVVDLHVPR